MRVGLKCIRGVPVQSIMETRLRRFGVIGLMFSVLAGPLALAQTRPPVVHDQRTRWDSRGWELLGVASPDGRYDRDVIRVGRNEGGFSQLMVSVSGGDLEIYDIVVTFGNGERFSPGTRFHFRGGASTGAIDLPGRARGIQTIEFRYGAIPGGGRPRVEVWGKPVTPPPPAPPPAPLPPPPRPEPPPPVRPPEWNPADWQRLGETTVDGRRDRDVLHVGMDEGRFSKLMLVAEGSDLDLYDMVVTFGNGERFDVPVRMRFHEGQRTGAIDLPGNGRGIREIAFRYGNLSGGGRARLEVWGRPANAAPSPPLPPPEWNPSGWRLLGEAEVAGRNDRDFIRVRGRHRYRQLMLEVKGGALEMYDVVVYFRDRSRYSPETRLVFGPESRTRPIDLPGDARGLRAIEFRYGNLPGPGRAYVRVWGR